MNRTIKFRGKLINSDEWLYGGYYQASTGENRIITVDETTGTITDWNVQPNTVGQFTGLLDKNGREIYEGDILSVRRYDNEFMSESEEFRDAFNIDELKGNEIEIITDCVFYEEASFYVDNLYLASLFGNQKHSNPIHEFEVIGNIHDHPELLNEK